MIRISCDICGKEMRAELSCRYVVKMEVFSVPQSVGFLGTETQNDPLDQLDEYLTDTEAVAGQIPPSFQKLRYDLCVNCHQRFLQDPLGRESQSRFDFSPN